MLEDWGKTDESVWADNSSIDPERRARAKEAIDIAMAVADIHMMNKLANNEQAATYQDIFIRLYGEKMSVFHYGVWLSNTPRPFRELKYARILNRTSSWSDETPVATFEPSTDFIALLRSLNNKQRVRNTLMQLLMSNPSFD